MAMSQLKMSTLGNENITGLMELYSIAI